MALISRPTWEATARTSLSGWTLENSHAWLPGFEAAPKDPWGNEYYVAKLEGTGKFAVFSMGPDGIDDTEDDLRSDRKDG